MNDKTSDKREETISVDNPEFALLVLGVERMNRATYFWKGKNKTYNVSEMSDEQLENIITMLHHVIENRGEHHDGTPV